MARIETVQYGRFEIEVGSPTYVRLIEQEKLTGEEPVTEVDIDPDEPSPGDGGEEKLSDLKVPELKERCEAAGIEIPSGAKKSDLVGLLEAHEAQQAAGGSSETLSE